MEDFNSTGQLVTLGLVDSSIGAMAEGLAFVDMEVLVVKYMLLSWKHSMSHVLKNFQSLALYMQPTDDDTCTFLWLTV